MLSSLSSPQHLKHALYEGSTHASNSTASIGLSGVDASSSVFNAANPPGFPTDQIHFVHTKDGLITYPCTDHSDAHCGPFVHAGHGVVENCGMAVLEGISAE
jgi:hypothetical protein